MNFPAVVGFNASDDADQPGVIRCPACGVECEGDNAFDALLLLITHMRSLKDVKHKLESDLLKEKLLDYMEHERKGKQVTI